MDPVSVFSVLEATGAAIGACTTITKAIRNFIKDVKKVDESTTKIKIEIKSLVNILNAVKSAFERFQSLSEESSLRMEHNVLVAVNGSVADCNSSLRRLVNILGYVRGADASGSGGVVQETQQTLRLRHRRRELDECRLEIERHKLGLNLSLTMVIFTVCSEPSSAAAPSSQPQEVSLLKLINKLRLALDRMSVAQAAEAEETKNQTILKDTAKQMLKKSTSTYAASSRDSVAISVASSSTAKDEFVESWINRLEEIEHDQEAPAYEAGPASDTSEKVAEYHDAAESKVRHVPTTSSQRSGSTTVKFSIKYKMAKNMISDGSSQYDLANYAQASSYFIRALEHASKLDPVSFAALDLDQVYSKLGSIYLRDKDFDKAEEYFKKLIADNNGVESELVLTAYVKLGEVCLSRSDPNRNDLDDGLMYCEEATDKIAQQFGEDCERYHEAVLLMAMIYFRKGLREDAESLLKEVPSHLHERVRAQPFNTSPKPPRYATFDSNDLSPKPRKSGFLGLWGGSAASAEPKTPRDSSSIATDSDIAERGGSHHRKMSEISTLEPTRTTLTIDQEPQSLLESSGFTGHFDVNKALNYAIKKGSDRTVNLLLQGYFIRARRKFHTQEELIEKKASPDGSSKSNQQSPLMLAISENQVTIARSLRDAGADLSRADSSGKTPLALAASLGHPEMLRLFPEPLIKAECAVDRGRNPLHIAVEKNHLEAVKLFLEAGATPNTSDPFGTSALKVAARQGLAPLVQLLLTFGANPALADDHANTPLMSAVRAGDFDSVASLVAASSQSEINACNHRGENALLFAASLDRWQEGRLLIEKGAEMEIADLNGWTPLIMACERGYVGFVEMLVERGANYNAKSRRGATCLDHAQNRKHRGVERALRGEIGCGRVVVNGSRDTEGGWGGKDNSFYGYGL